MPDCNYCEESFADEDAYLQHLGDAHDTDELSRIDRRRVADHDGDGGSRFELNGAVILVGLLVVTGGLMLWVTFGMGSNNPTSAAADVAAQTPTGVGSVHEHGTINVTIAGQRVDFSQPQYQNPQESPAFHFEGGDGRVWHKHARGVTLEYAMATLGIGVNESAVSFQGSTYYDSDPGTTVVVEVNGEPVDPKRYVLQGAETASEGDHVRIVVRTEN